MRPSEDSLLSIFCGFNKGDSRNMHLMDTFQTNAYNYYFAFSARFATQVGLWVSHRSQSRSERFPHWLKQKGEAADYTNFREGCRGSGLEADRKSRTVFKRYTLQWLTFLNINYEIHGKNDFVEILKNLDKYKSENFLVGSSKWLCRKLERDEQYCEIILTF